MHNQKILIAPPFAFLLILPFMIMEWLTGSDLPRSSFPVPLFVVLWSETTVFILLAVSIMKTWRAKRTGKWYGLTALKIFLAVILVWSWLEIVIDQMPCFLGATGC